MPKSQVFLYKVSEQMWGSENLPEDFLELLEQLELAEKSILDAISEETKASQLNSLEQPLEELYWQILEKFLLFRLNQAHQSSEELRFGPEKVCFDFAFLSENLAARSSDLDALYELPTDSGNALMYVHEWLEVYYRSVVKLDYYERLLEDKRKLEKSREAIHEELKLLKERRLGLVSEYSNSQDISALVEQADSLLLSQFFVNEKMTSAPSLEDRQQMAAMKGELKQLFQKRDQFLRIENFLSQAEEVIQISDTIVARTIDFFQARTDVEHAEKRLQKDEHQRKEITWEHKKQSMLAELDRMRDLVRVCARRASSNPSVLLKPKQEILQKELASQIIDRFEEFDPNIFRSTRVIRLGRPRILFLPGLGHGIYDWTNNLLIVPLKTDSSFELNLATAFVAYRLDLDEENSLETALKDMKSYRTKKLRKDVYNAFSKDYLTWLLVESQGYQKMNSEVRQWFLRYVAPDQEGFKVSVHLRRAVDQAEFPDELMMHYKKQFQDNNKNYQAILHVAVMLCLRGFYDKAIPLFEKILSRKSDMHDALYNLALCYQKTGQIGEAIKAWTAYLRRADQSFWTLVAQSHRNELKKQAH